MKKFLILFFIFFSTELRASGEVVYDVVNGKEWSLRSLYGEKIVKQLDENVETTFQWTAFTDSLKPGISKLNANLRRLATTDWLSDQMYARLLKDFRNREKVIREMYYSRSNSDDQYDRTTDPYPAIKEVELRLLSVVGSVAWIEVMFSADSDIRNRNELKIKYYYQGSMQTGELRRMSFSQVYYDRQALARFLAPLFTQQYLLQTDKLSEAEKKRRFPAGNADSGEEDGHRKKFWDQKDGTALAEDEEEEQRTVEINSDDSASVCADLCVHIDFSELDFYCFGWGLVVGFQEATSSSRIYNGEPFYIFLEGQQQRLFSEIVRLPELASPSVKPVNHFKDFSLYKLTDGFSMLRNAPDIYQLLNMEEKSAKRVQTLVMESYQLFENNQQNYRGRYVSFFHKDGYLTRKIFLDEKSDTVTDIRFVYDAANRLSELYGFGYRKQKEVKSYRYDQAGNLVFYEEVEGKEWWRTRYYYNGHVLFYFSMSDKEAPKEQLTEMSFAGKECCFKTACYKVNDRWQPLQQTNRKYTHEEVHIGRDEAGRLMEVHTENDRYNYYFGYDSLDRFALFSTYEETRPMVRLSYQYKDNNRLPYEQLKISLHSGQKIIEKEVYTWEFY